MKKKHEQKEEKHTLKEEKRTREKIDHKKGAPFERR